MTPCSTTGVSPDAKGTEIARAIALEHEVRDDFVAGLLAVFNCSRLRTRIVNLPSFMRSSPKVT